MEEPSVNPEQSSAKKDEARARVRLIQPDEAEGDVARFFEATTHMLGRVPNSARAMANSPHVAKFFLPFNAVLQREGAGSVLSCKIKEMVVLKTSHVNSCAY
jgi:hypothetical protein